MLSIGPCRCRLVLLSARLYGDVNEHVLELYVDRTKSQDTLGVVRGV